MDIDDLHESDIPRKLLDKKTYVRIDPETGEPQLVRVEPAMTKQGAFLPDTVIVTIDDGPQVVMERGAADAFIVQHGCVPLENMSDGKHRGVN